MCNVAAVIKKALILCSQCASRRFLGDYSDHFQILHFLENEEVQRRTFFIEKMIIVKIPDF